MIALKTELQKLPFCLLLECLLEHPEIGRDPYRKKLVQTLAKTAEIFCLMPDQLLASSRGETAVCWARIAAMASLRHAGLPLKVIGEFFGGRDHGTVIHAVKRLPEILTYCPDFAGSVHKLRSSLGLAPLNA